MASGDVIGPCKILRLVARGGMGEVYLAHHRRLDKEVAVKVLPSLSASPEMIRRFIHEGQKCAKVEHANVITIYDVGEQSGRYYIVMQYVDGKNLAELVKSQGPLPWRRALDLIRRAAEGLSAAHARNLVHRDIKPANILQAGDGRVVLMDFGLVRDQAEAGMTRTGVTMGTPAYMSREQCLGEKPDKRWDVYSLGATLYSLLTGRKPFQGTDAEVFACKINNVQPPPVHQLAPAVPREVSDFVARAMAHQPDHRFPDAASFCQHLDRLMQKGAPAPLVTPTAPIQTRTRPVGAQARCSSPLAQPSPVRAERVRRGIDLSVPRDKRPWLIGGGLVIGALLLLLMGLLWPGGRPPPPGTQGMVHIERGKVQLGNTEAAIRQHIGPRVTDPDQLEKLVQFVKEMPHETREVQEFWIDPYEVTNAQYARFLKETGRRPPDHWSGTDPPEGKQNHPVVNILYSDAEAYARWAGKKLPTHEQWVRAFRGDRDDLFPWGNQYDARKCNVGDNPAFPSTSPVDATPEDKSVFGVYNLVGNAAEFVRGVVTYEGDPRVIVKGARYTRSGYFYGNGAMCVYTALDVKHPGLGFRCVVERP